MNKLIFSFLAFVYASLVILNFIDTRDWHHLLGIKEGSIVVKSDIVPERETVKITNLSGPSIQVVHVNPNNPNQLIVNSQNYNYVSLDQGLTWSEIKLSDTNHTRLATWFNNAILVSTANGAFIASDDFGASWNPVTINTTSDEQIMVPEFSENSELSWKSIPISSLDQKTLYQLVLNFNRNGTPILGFSTEHMYHFELKDNVIYIKERYEPTWKEKPKMYQENIQFMHGKIRAFLSVSSDGLWAATQGGVFFQKQGNSNWQDKSASLGAHSFNGSFESQQGNKLLILDQIGRLAISEDKGKSWKSLSKNVSKAAFLNDESIVIVQQSGRVIVVDGDDTVEIAPNWKLILNKNLETTPYRYKNDYVYFIHGDKDHIWLTTFHVAYLQENPIEISHHAAMTKSSISVTNEVTVYHYNRNQKQWTAGPWSAASENKYAIENRCELSLNYDNIVSINGYRTSDYSVANKVMLIQSGNKYVHFNDSDLHIRTLKSCKPVGVKKVWDFDEIVRPAAYYETDEGLEIVSLGYRDNTIERIQINLNDTPPLWRWFFYFFYYMYGVYIIGIGLVIWFLNIRRKRSKT